MKYKKQKTIGGAVYVGTYQKYNNGSTKGAWLKFDDFADKEEMLDACKKLHADEADPELMFQDFEGFPKALYSETSLPDLWTLTEAITDSVELETICEYLADVGNAITPDEIEEACDAYLGTWASFQEYADEKADEMIETYDPTTKGKPHVPNPIALYFDYEKWARDLKHDYQVVDTPSGEVAIFRNQ